MDQVKEYTAKIDAFLAKYPSLTQYQHLETLEKKSGGYSKVYFFFGITALISLILYLLGGPSLLCNLVAFVYPAYASFKAIDSADPNDDTQWLTYWVVFDIFDSRKCLHFLD